MKEWNMVLEVSAYSESPSDSYVYASIKNN